MPAPKEIRKTPCGFLPRPHFHSSTKNPVLIFTETEAGHGPGKPIKKIIESQALILSFFAQRLGLEP